MFHAFKQASVSGNCVLRSGGSLTLHLALDKRNRIFRDVEHALEVRPRRGQRRLEHEHVAP